MPRVASLKYRSNLRNRKYPAVEVTLLTVSPVLGLANSITSNYSVTWRSLPVNTDIIFASSNTVLSDSPELYNIGQITTGTVTRTYTIKADANQYRGPKTLQFRAFINGVLYATSNEILVLDAVATYSISHSILNVNEGITVIFTFDTTNVPDGTVLYWNNIGTSSAADFVQAVNNGSVIINSNTASIFLTPNLDLITEGAETIIIELRYGSITGSLLATSSTINIADTSNNPISITAITPSSYAGASGQNFTITGTQFSNVAVVYFRTVDNVDYVLTTTFVNSSTLSAVTTRNFLVAEAPLTVRIVQGFSEAQFAAAVTCGSSPTWITPAGNIGPTLYDKTFDRSFSANVLAVDPDGGNITYSFVGTGYPVNTILNSSTGAITNSSIARVATTTLYSFIVRAADPIGNFTDRQFSISVLAPTVVVYSYTGGDQTFTVPAGIQYVEFKLWGAGGTATQSLTHGPIPVGGDGGFAQSTIPTTAGTTFTLIVGQSTYNRNGGLNYGGGRSGSYDGSYGGGDGGGRSAVRLGGTEILTAGGGGGGGMYWMTGPQPWASPGGVGGGLVGGGGGGYAWTAAGDGRTAGGGTQTAGGLGAKHQGPPPNTGNANDYTVRSAPGNGSQFAGGPVASSYAGGGGGGGWYGGGGGTGEKLQDSGTRWGGGGGSGWAGRNGASTLPGTNYGSVGSPEDVNGRTDTVTNITYYYTVVIQGRNSGDVHYGNNAGLGINVYNTPSAVGGHGRIVVIY